MLKILKFLNVFALVCVYQILQGQTVQPYALIRPYLCNGVSSDDNSLRVKIVNSGGPANWGNSLFTTNWDLRVNSQFGSIVRSGSFQGQVASFTISGLTFNSGDRFYIAAVGSGTNTAPLTFEIFDVTPKFTPTQPTITATALTICATGTVDLTAVALNVTMSSVDA